MVHYVTRSADDIHYPGRGPEKVLLLEQLPPGRSRNMMLVHCLTLLHPYYWLCDPNDQGAHPRSTLEVAIRRNDASLLELLLQHRADSQLREAGQEFPIIVAASRVGLSSVQILLVPGRSATEQVPSADLSGPGPMIHRCKTAIDVASTCPSIVEALQTAIVAAHARASPEVEVTGTPDNP